MRKNDSKKGVLNPKEILVKINRFILISVALLSLSVFVQGQSTTVFVDDFNRTSANLSSGGTPLMEWVFNRTLNPSSNIIIHNSATFQIFNNNSSNGTGTNGQSFMTGSLSNFHPLYKKVLNENVADVTWTFNMRNSKTSIAPLVNGLLEIGDNNYAPLMVLVSTNADFLAETANGYAVTLTRESSGTGIYRLVRFQGGLTATTNLTTLIESTSGLISGSNWGSVKVVYAPATGTWSLHIRDDGSTTAVKDPMLDDETTGLYTAIGSVQDNQFTSVEMTTCGFFYNHGKARTGAEAKANFDNFGVRVAANALSIDATLSDLSVSLDGENYETPMKFDPYENNYQYYLVKDHALPLVNAIKNDESATIDIVQAVNLRGTAEERKATITVTAEDTNITNVYTVEFIETEFVYLTGLGSNGGGGQLSNAPEGWAHGGSVYYTNTLPNGNNKYEGLAAFRCGNSSTLAWFRLPIMKGIGTLSFYARKVDLNVVGNIKIYVQDKGDTEWTEVGDLGDIYNLDYQEFTVPINRQATDSMYVKVEISKNGDVFSSPGYYFDDVAYTAYPGPGTDYSPELSRDFRIRSIQSGFAIDAEQAKVEIYNSIGVLQQNVHIKGTHQFNMDAPGMYIIRISTAKGQTSTKYLVR